MELMTLGIDQKNAVEAMLSGKNIFMAGKAGTGKSTVIREFIRRSERPVTLLAPTGTAALNIGGSTIHRLFKFPPADYISEDMARQAAESNAAVLASTKIIVIDEISMVRSELMTAMDIALKHVMPPPYCDLPFGGKQIIAVGDFCQLPPVIGNQLVQEFSDFMRLGLFAFQSPTWLTAKFEHICLNQVYRQNDPLLLDIANAIRVGNAKMCIPQDVLTLEKILTPMNFIDFLNHKCHCPQDIRVNPLYLCSRRLDAYKVNNLLLSALPDQGIISTGETHGNFSVELLPTNKILPIKMGARMMLLANKVNSDGSFDYTNGTIGTVIDYSGGPSPKVSIALDNGRVVTVSPCLWYNYDYELMQDGHGNLSFERREIGSFKQLPLTPSFAMTIHKCQGATLSGPVRIVLGSAPCFAPGQFYTALTRCRSLDQITIDRPVSSLDCQINEDVLWFHRQNGIS